jgi:hypothetical protein
MKSGFLSKYFPPPKFLMPSHIGISFSDTNIKAVMFDKPMPHPILKSLIVPIEKGVIVDGKIVNVESVVKALSAIKENFNPSFVLFTLPDELSYIFSTTIPVSKEGNATESVAFTIEENVPFPLADTIFDFAPINVSIAESGAEYQASVIVAACVKKELEKFVDVIKKAGLEPIGCLHESQSVANAVVPMSFNGACSIVHARAGRVGIYLVKNNIVNFATLRSIMDGDYKRQFLDEYDKFLEYSNKYASSKENGIQTVFVCGEFEYAKMVAEAIIDAGNIAPNTKLSNVWTNMLKIEEGVPSISYEESLNLSGPIGALLSDVLN